MNKKLFLINLIYFAASASWFCGKDGEWFPKADLQNCVSKDTMEVKAKVCKAEQMKF